MEQRHQEQLEALETKRQQIEEMEEKHRQSELKRVAEQDTKEKELEVKRRLMEQIQKEAESAKQEAEQVIVFQRITDPIFISANTCFPGYVTRRHSKFEEFYLYQATFTDNKKRSGYCCPFQVPSLRSRCTHV